MRARPSFKFERKGSGKDLKDTFTVYGDRTWLVGIHIDYLKVSSRRVTGVIDLTDEE